MLQRMQWIRILLTILGLVAFGILAAGTGSKSDSSYQLSPEEEGRAQSMGWARTNSPELATLLQDVESEMNRARSEIHRLQGLRSQFPRQADGISASIAAWEKVFAELDSATASAQEMINKAYVEVESQGRDPQLALEQVLSAWRSRANRALSAARVQDA